MERAHELDSLDLLFAWYGKLTPLERVGFWSLVGLGAAATIIAWWPPWLESAFAGALIASGTSMLVPLLQGADGIAALAGGAG